MRTAIITATNAAGETEILAGEGPYGDIKATADKLEAQPPAGYLDAVLWISDRPSKPLRFAAAALVEKKLPKIKAKA